MPTDPDATRHQRRVDAHFDAHAGFWRDLYGQDNLWGVVHQQRRRLALDWIDELRLPAGAHILEIGCGAGLLALDLARRGYTVNATDVSQAMVDTAREQVEEAGLETSVSVRPDDAHALSFPDTSFDLAVALGVLPFLHSPHQALGELRRVLRPGGYLLLTSDNRFRLNHLLDPALSPLTAPIRQEIKRRRPSGRQTDELPVHYYSWTELQGMLDTAGLRPVRSTTLGYGPFTLFGRSPLPERLAIALHQRLQTLGGRRIAPIRAVGAQHIVLAVRD